MKWWRSVIAALATIGVISAFWLKSAYNNAADAVCIQFVGITNDPTFGPSALLCVTNQAVSLIICAELAPQVHASSGWADIDHRSPSGLGYLQPGESYVFAVPVPGGPEPWRLPVMWQRRELSRFEGFINGQHDRLMELLGKPHFHRDPWLPFNHVVYSPEMGR